MARGAVSQGRTFVGEVPLFGRPYASIYEPVVKDGAVIGVLYFGTIQEASAKKAA